MVEFNTFGEALKFFANKKNLSQKQLAIKCDIQEGQISRHKSKNLKIFFIIYASIFAFK
jgi:transcriptional regulator with XRE-family HTH domain